MKYKLIGSGDEVSQHSRHTQESENRKLVKASQKSCRNLLSGLLGIAVALTSSWANPVSAAERVSLRIGPFEQSVSVDELEQFAESGTIPRSLRMVAPLLTPQFRELLTKRLQVDPSVGDKFLNELLESRDGERLIRQLRLALPESEVEALKAALYLTLRQANGLNALSFLRAYPEENLVIDATSAASIALQLNASNLQSRILGPVLEQQLKVEDTGSFLPSFDPGLAGEQQVTKRTLIFQDNDRRRTIPADIYYGTQTQGQLVVMSHGFAADRRFLAHLAQHLASHGFTVVSLEHPGSSVTALSQVAIGVNPSSLISASEFVERPKDISFLLDELSRLSERRSSFAEKINTDSVTVIGHSLGGYTALALAGGELNLRELRNFCQDRSPLGRSPGDWLQCAAADLPYSALNLRDERVSQVVTLNPLVGQLFGSQGLAKIQVPVMLLSSSDDAITPALDHQLRPFGKIPGEKYLLTAIGGTHLSVTDLRELSSQVSHNTLVREVLGQDAEPVKHWIRGTSLAFLHQLSPDATNYKPFLSPAYAQFLSPPPGTQANPMQLRFTTEFSVTTNTWLQMAAIGQDKITFRPQPKSSSSIVAGADRCFTARRFRFLSQTPPQFCTVQLNHIFNSFVNNHFDDYDYYNLG